MGATIHSVDLYCRVIDNFGDAGVCWRLARDFAQRGLSVTLWIDDLARLARLRPALDPALDCQQLDGFTVRGWPRAGSDQDCADLVIEAFGCDLPEAVVQRMLRRPKPPAWINLEYLSAESWIEGCHGLPSPHPQLPLTRYFFFPGFTTASGGLLREAGLARQQAAFDAQARAAFLAGLGIPAVPASQSLLVSLFCYPQAPVEALFDQMQSGPPVCCVVPEGVASDALHVWLDRAPVAGAQRTRGSLSVCVIPFVAPDDYDRLLWSCDLNHVRGEDSLVRAHWAGKPFIWQLYRQAEDAHLTKLDAFLARHLQAMAQSTQSALASQLSGHWHAWNGDVNAQLAWPGLRSALPELAAHALDWRERVEAAGELAPNIIEFANKIG